MLQKVEYSRIKDERVMRACTVVDFARLEDLSQILGSYYKKTHGICYFKNDTKFEFKRWYSIFRL